MIIDWKMTKLVDIVNINIDPTHLPPTLQNSWPSSKHTIVELFLHDHWEWLLNQFLVAQIFGGTWKRVVSWCETCVVVSLCSKTFPSSQVNWKFCKTAFRFYIMFTFAAFMNCIKGLTILLFRCLGFLLVYWTVIYQVLGFIWNLITVCLSLEDSAWMFIEASDVSLVEAYLLCSTRDTLFKQINLGVLLCGSFFPKEFARGFA